ncbi:hypothetical protein R3P38DRAFT_1255110 [Favolaschia claudopus]|uniref:Uncharacterized protein n=1 Tax=Favolaschia claudopus TaxID=2862362 RepID=A0AAW0B307_9AGAR
MYSGSDTSSTTASAGSPPGSNASAESIGEWRDEVAALENTDADSDFSPSNRSQFDCLPLSLLPSRNESGPLVPQRLCSTPYESETGELHLPIIFDVINSSEYGILVSDALNGGARWLRHSDDEVVFRYGPSLSIQLEWPGYQQWSRRIRVPDSRSPPRRPFTMAMLARSIARCIRQFVLQCYTEPMQADADERWKIGPGPNEIKLEDLILECIDEVAKGCWQPQLKLRRPL